MGREKRNEKHTEHYTKLVRNMMSTPAWKALSPTAQALYPWVRFEWRGPHANNNGKLRLSVRQAAECLGCNIKTAARAFHDLQAKGFLVVTEPARLGLTGEAKSPAYELTELGLQHTDKPYGRRLYLEWRLGGDFAVHKAAANNPTGANGKTKPCAHYGDKVVPIKGTNR